MSKHKWLFVSFMPRFPSIAQIVGGIQVRPYELFNNLRKLGHQVHVWQTHSREKEAVARNVIVNTLNLPRSKVLTEIIRFLLMLRTFICEIKEAKAKGLTVCFYQQVPGGIRWGFQLVPICSMPGFLLFPVARLMGMATWAAVHDLPPYHEQYVKRLYRQLDIGSSWQRLQLSLMGWMHQLHLKFAFRFSSIISVVSEEMRRFTLKDYHLNSQQVVVFRSACNPMLLDGISTWHPPEKSPWTIGYLGSPLDASLPALLDAVRLLNSCSVRLLLAGQSMRQILEKQSVKDIKNIIVQEAIYSDFPLIASQVDIWVIVYSQDKHLDMAWELKVPLYIASGRPVIRSLTTEVGHSGLKPFLFLTDSTPESIAERIQYIMQHPQVAARKAQEGCEFILREMTWETTTGHLLNRLESTFRSQENQKG